MCVYVYARDDGKGCQTADEKRLQEKLAAFRFFFPKGEGGGLTWKEVERAGFSCEHRPSAANLCNVVVDLFREIRRTRFLRNLFGVIRV